MKKLKFLPLSGEPIDHCVTKFQQLTDEVCEGIFLILYVNVCVCVCVCVL